MHQTSHAASAELTEAAREAASRLRRGAVIAYPTEAVWGLGADPANEHACLRLLQIKGRSVEKGMILVAASLAQIEPLLAPLSDAQRECLAAGWASQAAAGPLTFLVPDLLNQVPLWVKGKHPAVALRVSDHIAVKALCEAFGAPLVSTSANPAGLPPARTRQEVEQTLGSQVDYIMAGTVGTARQPSRIVDLLTGQEIRPG